MNFFQAQDNARARTGWLIILFIAAIALTVAVLYFILVAVISHTPDSGIPAVKAFEDLFVLRRGLLLDVTVGVLALVSIGSIYKTLVLSGGGARVAESMGGVPLLRESANAEERQLLNIVEEIAIAAGTPVPEVYRVRGTGINAFAAGTTPGNAVIGVSTAAIRQLTREQMQGVIAHEFSHIMNGDMRLNIRLTAVIHGLMLMGYIGYFLMRIMAFGGRVAARDGYEMGGGGGDARAKVPLFFLGLALTVAGFIGTFFGSWIRAAVSRQREFLADAAAVQYTRNPNGIAGALERIGQTTGMLPAPRGGGVMPLRGADILGSAKQDESEAEYSHMLFSGSAAVGFLNNPFSTHPPLRERIRRILPNWNEREPLNTTAPPPPYDPAHATPRRASPGIDGIPAAPDSAAAVSGFFNAGDTSAATNTPNTSAAAPNTPPPAASPSPAASTTPPHLAAPGAFTLPKPDAIAATTAAAALAAIGNVNTNAITKAHRALEKLPAILATATDDPYSARALIYILIIDRANEAARDRQLAHLEANADAGVYDLTLKFLPASSMLPPTARLILAQRALPALRRLSPEQYRLFLTNLAALIAVDETINLFEWCLQAMVVHALHDTFSPHRRAPGGDKRAAKAYALSILARAGQAPPEIAFAAGAQAAGLKISYTPDAFEPQRLFDALQIIAHHPPRAKQRFATAAAHCVATDGRINADEASLLRAYFMLLDSALPIFADED